MISLQVFKLHLILSIVNGACAFHLFSTAPTTITTSISLRAINEPTSSHQDNQFHETIMNRRSLINCLLVAGTLGTSGSSMIAQAEDVVVTETPVSTGTTSGLESVYFGVGCFWHIQHEFVAAERDLLGRSDRELTAFTGYAGGTASDKFNRVCYHNFQSVADYGKYGHGEVVGMKLPTDKIVDFTKVYFSLYNPKTLGTYW